MSAPAIPTAARIERRARAGKGAEGDRFAYDRGEEERGVDADGEPASQRVTDLRRVERGCDVDVQLGHQLAISSGCCGSRA